jgi:hypothetical protein
MSHNDQFPSLRLGPQHVGIGGVGAEVVVRHADHAFSLASTDTVNAGTVGSPLTTAGSDRERQVWRGPPDHALGPDRIRGGAADRPLRRGPVRAPRVTRSSRGHCHLRVHADGVVAGHRAAQVDR